MKARLVDLIGKKSNFIQSVAISQSFDLLYKNKNFCLSNKFGVTSN